MSWHSPGRRSRQGGGPGGLRHYRGPTRRPRRRDRGHVLGPQLWRGLRSLPHSPAAGSRVGARQPQRLYLDAVDAAAGRLPAGAAATGGSAVGQANGGAGGSAALDQACRRASTASAARGDNWLELAGFEFPEAARQWGTIAVSVAGDWQVLWGESRGVRQIDQLPEAARPEGRDGGIRVLCAALVVDWPAWCRERRGSASSRNTSSWSIAIRSAWRPGCATRSAAPRSLPSTSPCRIGRSTKSARRASWRSTACRPARRGRCFRCRWCRRRSASSKSV